MKVVLYNAISADGFIATIEGNSDWVNDEESFTREIENSDCIIIGRKTYEQFYNELYPIEGIKNVVYTSNPDKYNAENYENVLFSNTNPEELVNILEKEGLEKILLVGGSKANTTFLEANVIDEIILDIHPIVIGKGIKLFDSKTIFDLEHLETKIIENDLTQIRYKVVRK